MHSLSLRLKRVAIRAFISFVRVGAVSVYWSKRFFGWALSPVTVFLRMGARLGAVPAYRVYFSVRRALEKMYMPSRGRLGSALANRFAFHGLLVLLLVMTVVSSVAAQGVREEDYGHGTPLYSLVSDRLDEQVEVVSADIVAESNPVRYQGFAFLTPAPDTDYDLMDDLVDITTGGGAIIAPPTVMGGDSVAPRTETMKYTVASGDTISTIAAKHGISVNTLLWANNLTVRSTIRPGDSLTVLPFDGITYTVKKGDTILAIAKKYQAEAAKIVEANQLANAGDLSVGDALLIPGGIRPAAPPPTPRSVANVFRSTPQALPSNAGSVKGSGRMAWPGDLHVITQYFGWRHTGVDVDCYFTNDNFAADDGVVQFAGWKGGYGLTVEVNHGNGIVTRYGHHAKIYVRNGQTVSRGTPLGLCGTTGRSTGTHLHFEVIVGGKFRNPLEFVR